MVGIIGIIAALTVLGLSLVVTRLATVALTHTGLSRESARFQARSAFTGTGFTTTEAEKVVGHPVRRQIIMLLMIARSAGFLTITMSLILSFATEDTEQSRIWKVVWLMGGVLVLWFLARSRQVDRYLQRLIERALARWTDLDVRDYISLLKLSGDYGVKEMQVEEGDWLAGRKLSECRLGDEGVTVLGLYRADGSYVGAPKGGTRIHAGDVAIFYGYEPTLRDLDDRRDDPTGEAAHEAAVDEQKKREEEEERQNEEYERQREQEEDTDGRNDPE